MGKVQKRPYLYLGARRIFSVRTRLWIENCLPDPLSRGEGNLEPGGDGRLHRGSDCRPDIGGGQRDRYRGSLRRLASVGPAKGRRFAG